MTGVDLRSQQYHAVVERILTPGETLVMMPDASYIVGPETIAESPVPTPGPASPERIQATKNALTYGEAVVGEPGSLAVRLRTAMNEVALGGRDGELVLTDRRMLVLDKLIAPATVIWECRRDEIAAAKVTPGLGYAGRTCIAFTDGSGIALLLSIVFRAPALKFADELNRQSAAL